MPRDAKPRDGGRQPQRNDPVAASDRPGPRRAPTGGWLILAGLHGAMAMVLSAYAAHGMRAAFSAQAVAWVDTGSRLQLVHAAALAAVALLAERAAPGGPRWAVRLAGWGFALGAALFAGALYGLAFTGNGGFGTVAPFGGAAMILGWVALAAAGGLWRRA